ncbi:hypothetical protein [[Mycobacterium] crassicus]|uniref:Uncharacterized protein n=1 Tax=[Mycobacterium] crassicus TaxID=2872309 RepID=A0ABU5XGB2_9MYCO|nr:hypothetical protein [Mycolicibacter sp. MYC098]MEB3020387.1 hypothetical protein [Mycolicibacter sp. MYC098]
MNQSPTSSPTPPSRRAAQAELETFQNGVANFAFDLSYALLALHVDSQASATLEAIFRENETRAVIAAEFPLLARCDDGSTRGDLATLRANYKLCLDSYGKYLAVEHSTLELKSTLERAPIIRWDYDRDAHSKPHSHVQVTAHRGAASHILSQLEHPTPHSFQSLHIPMGAERFRPCIEDVIEFLIADCGFCAGPNWREVIANGRTKWRRLQTRAAVRDSPGEAVEVLREMGYAVELPESGEVSERIDKLRAW